MWIRPIQAQQTIKQRKNTITWKCSLLQEGQPCGYAVSELPQWKVIDKLMGGNREVLSKSVMLACMLSQYLWLSLMLVVKSGGSLMTYQQNIISFHHSQNWMEETDIFSLAIHRWHKRCKSKRYLYLQWLKAGGVGNELIFCH